MIGTEGSAVATVVVLTALEDERRAVLAHLVEPRTWKHRAGTRFDVAALPTPGWRVVLASGAQGNSAAAALATEAIVEFAPAAVLLVGIAGGLWPSVGLGDVVIATKVYGIHGGRDDPDGPKIRPEAWQPDLGLLELAKQVDRDRSWQILLPEAVQPRQPAVHFAPTAAGEVVLNSTCSPLADHLRRNYNDAIAIDTEDAGFAQAIYRHRETAGLVIRGMSDLSGWLDKRVTDPQGWRKIAVAAAASYAVALFTQYTAETEPALTRRTAYRKRLTDRPSGRVTALLSTPGAFSSVPPSRRHVFVSYSSDDISYVRMLVARLRSTGLEVWVDEQIRAGRRWDQLLREKKSIHAQLCYW